MILPLKYRTISLFSNPLGPSITISSPFSSSSTSFSSSLVLKNVSEVSRRYLEDYQLLTNTTYLLSQSKDIVLLSLTVQGIELMNEYSQHLEKQIQAQQAGRACPPDFDFNKAIPDFFSKSYYRLIRNIWNFLTRKAYEAIFVAQLSPKLADRLTKDISKSISRKLTKYSQQETSRRIFWTCLHGSLLRALSLFTVDCGYAIYQYLMNENKEKRAKTPKGKNKASPTHVAVSLTSPSTLLNILIWTGKRAIFHTLSILFFSGGYSVGLMVSPKYTPVWFATLFESLGGAILAPLLC